MSDDPVRAPFAAPLPPAPVEEVEAKEDEQAPPQPLTDADVYGTPPAADPKVTHHAMSTEDLKEIGCDEDGNPIEPEEPTDPPVDPPVEEEI